MESLQSDGGLGSLAQSARTKQLKSARGILFAIGILTVIVNAVLVFAADSMVKSEIDNQIRDLHAQRMEVDRVAVEQFRAQAVRSVRLMNGIGVLLGVVFIACGTLVYKYPVPVTVISLVLYIGAAAVYGVLDPTTLARGWIIKILIVAGLFKAVQAALAYESERKQSATPPPLEEAGAVPV